MLSTSLFLVSLAIFVALAMKSRTIKSFSSQVSAFVGIYVIGEVLELNVIQNAAGLPAELGSQVHVAATIIITLVMWSRLLASGRAVKELEREQNANKV